MATYINTNGLDRDVTPKDGNKFSLEELQNLVGGYVERIAMPNGQAMYINEEGKFNDLPLNRRATTILKLCGLIPYDYIVGNVVILSNE